MKRFLFLLLAAGGLLFATAGEASAGHWRGPYGYGYGYGVRGGGVSISIGRGYPGPLHRPGWGYRYPVRRRLGFRYGYAPPIYSTGYYGGGYYGGGYYGGGCRY